MHREIRNARLTILIDPRKKKAFEHLCELEDTTPSQKIRQMIRDYLAVNIGPDWQEKVFKD